jgi:hypothetical protein
MYRIVTFNLFCSFLSLSLAIVYISVMFRVLGTQPDDGVASEQQYTESSDITLLLQFVIVITIKKRLQQ